MNRDGDGPGTADFDAFFSEVLPRTVAVARRVTGEVGAAEDAAVEALARAHLHWGRVASLPWRDGWVLRAAAREALRQQRRVHVLEPAPAAAATADDTDAVVGRQLVAAALRRLPKRQREVVVLRYLADLPEPEVAAVLGLHLGTVKTHLRRALKALRGTLGESWDVSRGEGGTDELT